MNKIIFIISIIFLVGCDPCDHPPLDAGDDAEVSSDASDTGDVEAVCDPPHLNGDPTTPCHLGGNCIEPSAAWCDVNVFEELKEEN